MKRLALEVLAFIATIYILLVAASCNVTILAYLFIGLLIMAVLVIMGFALYCQVIALFYELTKDVHDG